MGFEDLLRKKLGPMRDLVARPSRNEPEAPDPSTLWYRRAAGLEVRARPEETWAQLEVRRTDRSEWHRISMHDGGALLGLTRFRAAAELFSEGLSARQLWRWVEDDLAFWARSDPNAPLTGDTGALAAGSRIARRASMWPTAAVETAVRVSPMPFMPRGRDLAGAELVGVRFASLERGHEVLGVTITGTRRTGDVLRHLLPRLDGRHDAEGLVASIDERLREDARKMLALLDRCTVLESRDGLPAEAARFEYHRVPREARHAGTSLGTPLIGTSSLEHAAPQVAWLGHAGVWVQAGGTSLLVDPLFHAASEPPELHLTETKFDPRALPPVDAVLITHGDNDHLNPGTLAQLPRETPIYIPHVGASPPPYQVDLRGILRVLGFERVMELAPGSQVQVGAFEVTAYPFEGESWDLELAKVTYLVECAQLSVFFSADSDLMDDTYRAIAERGRRVDLAFMGVSGCAETFVMPTDLGYGNFYEDYVPRVRHNEWVRHCAGPEEAAHSLSLFSPRYAFGYAAGGASFIQTQYSDVGDHDQLARRIAELGLDTRAVAMPLGEPVTLDALASLPALRSG